MKHPEETERQPIDAGHSRMRCILTLGVAAIGPVIALNPVLVINQQQERGDFTDLLAGMAFAVFLALTARGIASIVRWIVIGSAPVVDRLVWGGAYVAMLSIAGGIAFEAAPVAYTISAYALVFIGFWSIARLFGAALRRCGASSKLRLIDLIAAMALLGLIAGASKFLIETTRYDGLESFVGGCIAGLALGLTVGTLLLGVDAIVRRFVDARTDVETRSFDGLGLFFAMMMSIFAMIAPPLAVPAAFVASYLLTAAVQEVATASLFDARDYFATDRRIQDAAGVSTAPSASLDSSTSFDGEERVG